jgi:thiol-disulfide isomerase/thioredoxin
MKPTLKFFYSESCHLCESLKPIITELNSVLNIQMINTETDTILTENYNVEWVPSLVIEDQTGKHIFEGVEEIKQVLKKLIS